jgi:hypothetical protein
MVVTEVRKMNISYLLYEAERPRSTTEQRETDVRTGELAAAVARLGRSLRHRPAGDGAASRTHRASRTEPQASCRPSTESVACLIPRQR